MAQGTGLRINARFRRLLFLALLRYIAELRRRKTGLKWKAARRRRLSELVPTGAIISETSYSLTLGGQIGLTYDFSARATAVAAVKFLKVASGDDEYRIFELGLRYWF